MVINTMRIALSFWLALVVTVFAGALTVDPADARVHAEAVRATYPRPEASAGEKQLIDYIDRAATADGLTATIRDFSAFSSGHSFSRVVEVVVPGTGASTVVVVAPLNHPEDAGPDDDRSASVAAALTVMDAVAREGARPTYRFVFPGAEYGDAGYPKGTRLFLDDYFAEEPHALVYLDVSRLPTIVETGGGGIVTPSWLVEDVANAARSTGMPSDIRADLNQIHRLGISTTSPALVDYLRAGIPAVLVRSGPESLEPPSVEAVTLRLAEFLAAWSGSYAAGVPSTWDHHYLYFTAGARQIVIGERVFLAMLLAVLLSTLLYSLVFRRQLGRYLRTIARNSWNLPVLFVLIFGFLSAATYLVDLSLVIRRFPTIWEHYPGAYFGFKITLSLFLFSIAALLLRHLPLSKNGSFYSAAALFVLFVDIILFSVINLAFSSYFIWGFVCAFVFSVVRFRSVKAIALVLAPVPLVMVAVAVLRVPELRLTGALLLSTRGDLLLSFMTLPFLLMLLRMDFLVRHPVRGRRGFALRLASIVTGVAVAGMTVFVLLSTPYSPANPQPVHLTDTIDYPQLVRTLEISSPAPIGDVRVLFAGEEHDLSIGGRSYELTSERLPDALSARLSYEEFLDRDRGRLDIDAPLPIDDVVIRFYSNDPMVIYDVSYPFSITPDHLEATVDVGKRPPIPLEIDFTVARGTYPNIEIVATGASHPDDLAITGANLDATSEFVVRTRLE